VHASGAAAEHDHVESAHISPSPSNFESLSRPGPVRAGASRPGPGQPSSSQPKL